MCVTGQSWPLAPSLAQCEKLSHDLTFLWEPCIGGLEGEVGEKREVFQDLAGNIKHTCESQVDTYHRTVLALPMQKVGKFQAHRKAHPSLHYGPHG